MKSIFGVLAFVSFIASAAQASTPVQGADAQLMYDALNLPVRVRRELRVKEDAMFLCQLDTMNQTHLCEFYGSTTTEPWTDDEHLIVVFKTSNASDTLALGRGVYEALNVVETVIGQDSNGDFFFEKRVGNFVSRKLASSSTESGSWYFLGLLTKAP